MPQQYITDVYDADGNTVNVNLADPPDWLDVDALYSEAAHAGDLELCRMIEAARPTR